MYKLGSALTLIAGTAIAETTSYADHAGHYVDTTLPAKIMCPSGGWVLSPDGQLRELKIGAQTLEVKQAYQCKPDPGGFSVCAKGDVANGVVQIPPQTETPSFKRLTLTGSTIMVLGSIEGDSKPLALARCPNDFQTMAPHATPEAFIAQPLPAVVGEGAFDIAAAKAGAWQSAGLRPLPISGVFGDHILSQASKELENTMLALLLEQASPEATPKGAAQEGQSPDTIRQSLREQKCYSTPRVFTKDGFMLAMQIVNDSPARIKEVYSCAAEGKTIHCRKAKRSADGGYEPDEKGRERRYTLNTIHETQALCRPGKTPEDDGACAQLTPCPDAALDIPVLKISKPLRDMVTWSP